MNTERLGRRPTAKRLGLAATVLVASAVGIVAVLFSLLAWSDTEVPEAVGSGLTAAALGLALVGLCLGVWTCRRSEWGIVAAVCGALFLLGTPVWGFALGVAAMNQDMRLHPRPPAAAPGPPPAPPPSPPGG